MTQQTDTAAAQAAAMERVRSYMRQAAHNPAGDTPTGQVLQHLLDLSGKMLRPRLLLCCAGFGPRGEARQALLCRLAALVELTHLSSLVHDDIIDDAPLRRGKPSVQSRYGKDAAVYAGDFLISRVYYHLAEMGLSGAAMRLSRTVEQMCLGEIGQARCKYRTDVTPDAYYENIRGKTASLFACCCALGAAESGCTDAQTQTLAQFGERVGMLFQLRDDLLDFAASAQKAGKQTHKDFKDGIYTLPVLLALQDPAGKAALGPLMAANPSRALTDAEIARMEQTVLACGGVAGTWAEIHRLAAEARALLAQLPDGGPKETLKGMLDDLDRQEPAL